MICITPGDANGVGPEILLKAAAAGALSGNFVVSGDLAVLEACARRLNISVELSEVAGPDQVRRAEGGPRTVPCLPVINLGLMSETDIEPGRLSRKSGEAAVRYVEHATRLALAGSVTALVTLPINKEASRIAVPNFTGHTELIADLCGQTDYTMMLISDRFAVTHVSTHVPLSVAIGLVRRERVETVIGLTHEALSRFLAAPRIAVAGLNPHAGEHGAFGTEDNEEILPAVKAARERGWNVSGPEAPDTVFHKAANGQFDAVVCMYHDQGHIPMKLLDFDGGVNVTLGLSVIRTSVDHGTAFDIAWQGKASTNSFLQAYRFARKLAGEK